MARIQQHEQKSREGGKARRRTMSSNKKETKKAKAPQGQIEIAMNNPKREANMIEMINKAAQEPHKELSAERRAEMKQLLSQHFVDSSCAFKAEWEGQADWGYFVDCGNEAANVIKAAIATGDEELTSLACYLNDALIGIKYFHNAKEVLLPIWAETMPRDMLGNLVATSVKNNLERR